MFIPNLIPKEKLEGIYNVQFKLFINNNISKKMNEFLTL